jgi:hypothetical protein
MIAKLTFVSSALVLGTLIAPQMSSAASFSPAAGFNASDSSLVQTVQYRSCGYWRRECADRWGWGTWRWRRCLARHDCYY